MTTFQLLRIKSSSIPCLSALIQGLESAAYDNLGWGTCGSANNTKWDGCTRLSLDLPFPFRPPGGSRALSGNRQVEREWKNSPTSYQITRTTQPNLTARIWVVRERKPDFRRKEPEVEDEA
jgi:hypothetical protein